MKEVSEGLMTLFFYGVIMEEVKIFDNFLKEDECQFLKEMIIWNDSFPWFMHKQIGTKNEPEHLWSWYGTHCFYDHRQPQSSHWDSLNGILLGAIEKRIEVKALLRIKANFFGNTETLREHEPHVDYKFPNISGIYCLNTCNGYSRLEDGTKIDSVENRFYIFNGGKLHNSTSTTNVQGRFNINVNFL